MLDLPTTKDSKASSAWQNSPKTKIPLFYKPLTIKVCFLLVLFIYVFTQTNQASASFFSNLMTNIFGAQTHASEIAPLSEDVVHNSQNIPLLESSVNPDLKNIKDEPVVPTLSPSDPVVLANIGTLDTDSDLENSASSEKIVTYTVKEGDTLEGIAKKLKVLKSTIIASNTDLKKSDLLKIGQILTIITLKSDLGKSDIQKTDTTTDQVVKGKKPVNKPSVVDKEEPKVETPPIPVVETPPVQIVQPPVELQPQLPQPTPELSQPSPSSGQPTGDINGGYIWPFPAGIGRISQGLHGDNAYDFSAPKGTPIYAIQNGTVLIAHHSGYNGGYGKYIVINFDDGRQAIFGHMNQVSVEAGQVVKQGEVIGLVGSTGKSTGPHTHIGFHGSLGNPYLGLKVNSTSEDFHD